MTVSRRSGLTLALTLAAVLGSAGFTAPARAAFSASATVSTSIETATVAAPTEVQAACTTVFDPDSLTSTTEMKVAWQQSTSPGVTGYLITVYPVGGSAYELARTGATDAEYTSSDQALLTSKPRFTVTTLTSYGWTAESRRTAVVRC